MKTNAGKYLLVVTGSIPLEENGIYTTIGGRTAKEILEEAAKGAAAVIAIGACAHWGSVQAARPNPTGAVGCPEVIKDKPVVNIAGCPPIGDVVTATIVHYLTFNRLPELDAEGRPLFAYGARIHDQCPRRANFDAGQFVEEFDDEAARKGWCLYKVGCKGPATFSPCPIFQWNTRTSWPIGAGHPCIGCTEPDFWDTMTPVLRAAAGRRRLRRRAAGRPASAPRSPSGPRRAWARTPSPPASTRYGSGSGSGSCRCSRSGDRRQRPAGPRPGRRSPMAKTRVVVDPITRIEGHLRIEAQAENGRITNAWATSTQFRGIEIIMQGRDPARRLGLHPADLRGLHRGARGRVAVARWRTRSTSPSRRTRTLIRNLIHGMQYIQDHVIHFYHLHALDWVDVVSALKADPAGTAAIARKSRPGPTTRETYFREVQDRLKKFVAGGQLGIFTNGYWGHPAYKLPPEVNLLAVAHYLEALDWQRDVIRLHTVFGGKNPHPNFLVGGMACAINLDEHRDHQRGAADRHPRHDHRAPSSSWSRSTGPTCSPSPASTRSGRRLAAGSGTTWPWASSPTPTSATSSGCTSPAGIMLDRDLTRVQPYDQNKVKEYINSSWYEYSERRRCRAAPLGGRDQAQVHRAADAVEVPPGLRRSTPG